MCSSSAVALQTSAADVSRFLDLDFGAPSRAANQRLGDLPPPGADQDGVISYGTQAACAEWAVPGSDYGVVARRPLTLRSPAAGCVSCTAPRHHRAKRNRALTDTPYTSRRLVLSGCRRCGRPSPVLPGPRAAGCLRHIRVGGASGCLPRAAEPSPSSAELARPGASRFPFKAGLGLPSALGTPPHRHFRHAAAAGGFDLLASVIRGLSRTSSRTCCRTLTSAFCVQSRLALENLDGVLLDVKHVLSSHIFCCFGLSSYDRLGSSYRATFITIGQALESSSSG